MHAGAADELSGDRASDRRTSWGHVPKPAVLRRTTLRGWCAASLAVIAYGTLGPLGIGRQPWLAPPRNWGWVPPCQHTDLNDVLTNLAVYIPVGVAFRLLVRRRGRAGWPDFMLGLALSIALSYTTELLQQAMPARSSNLLDVAVNALAALVGCSIAVPVQRAVRWLHACAFVRMQAPWRPWSLMAWLSAAAAALFMTLPWNLAQPSAQFGFDEPLNTADLRRFTMFAIIGFFGTGAAVMRGRTRGRAVLGAAAWTGLLAVVLEAAQAVLRAHVCSLVDALIAIAGGIAGCVASAWAVRPPAATRADAAAAPRLTRAQSRGGDRGEPTCYSRPAAVPAAASAGSYRRLAVAALVVTLVYAAGVGIWRTPRLHGVRAEPLVHWAPFQAHFVHSFAHTTVDIAEQVGLYSFLTLLCLILTGGRGRTIALLLVLGLLGALEIARAFVAEYGADTTALLLATVAWLLTTRVWRSIYPRGRVADTRAADTT